MFDFIKKRNTQSIYLDYASTTPVLPEVFSVMKPYFSLKFFNPSSLYDDAINIKKDIGEARESIAKNLAVKKDEIYFTGSGTEADNISILGVFEYFKRDENFNSIPHIITSKIEHPAILESCKEVERRGGEVSYVNVNEDGVVDIEEIKKNIKDNTILVSIMYANNEIGTIQPISQIGRMILKWKSENKKEVLSFPYFHSDASQAPVYLNVELSRLHLDLMTLDGSKIYGPKGVGVLAKKNYVNILPISFGGGQENSLRPSTENPAVIIGFSKALEIVLKEREKESLRIKGLQEYMIDEILKNFKGATLNGSRENRLPNNINICFRGRDAEFMVIQLSEKKIACSFMTACKNLDDQSRSYVIDELKNGDCSLSSIRFTLGRNTKKKDINYALSALKGILL